MTNDPWRLVGTIVLIIIVLAILVWALRVLGVWHG